ncbi:hypothetical protein [Thermogutta terrifontis]|uniref:hypothetical protein n=1 Tax=Thermogutta terrifontis TaxID=1331910 RepID=UPI000BA841C5|nr:hypothetical protein [Thermogutta terrifontis]
MKHVADVGVGVYRARRPSGCEEHYITERELVYYWRADREILSDPLPARVTQREQPRAVGVVREALGQRISATGLSRGAWRKLQILENSMDPVGQSAEGKLR